MASAPELLSIAPMLDVTTSVFRHVARLLSREITLYTEMHVDQAIIHRARDLPRFVGMNPESERHKTILQLGGSSPHHMAHAAKLCQSHLGYHGFNVNVGCPSHKVQKGAFGCSLMRHPAHVADIVRAMADAVQRPVSVKCRLGVDHVDSYDFVADFVAKVTAGGAVDHVVVHARKAWLAGLSPKQNRTIPPLEYPKVSQLVRDFPHLRFTINGGITSLPLVKHHLASVHAVMIGRQAETNPWLLTAVDREIYGKQDDRVLTRLGVIEEYKKHVEDLCRDGQQPMGTTKMLHPIRNLFFGQKGSKELRVLLDQYTQQGMEPSEILARVIQSLADFQSRTNNQQQQEEEEEEAPGLEQPAIS